MMFDVHPPLFHGLTSRKQNRENRIKSACLSNSHSNIAPSNNKRLLFVQILAIPSASLVSTSLPIQCLRPSNFFFFRRIFLNSFLRHRNLITREQNLITRQLVVARASSNFHHVSSKFDQALLDFASIGDKKTRARAEAAQRTSRTI